MDCGTIVSVSTTFFPGANLGPLPPDLIFLSSDTVFFYVHGGRFARSAHDANAVGALCDMPVDQFAQARVVDATVLMHGGDKGNDAAFQGDCRCGHDRERGEEWRDGGYVSHGKNNVM